MSRLVLALAGCIVVAPLAGAPGPVPAGEIPFAGFTAVHSEGSEYGRFSLAVDSGLTLSLETDSYGAVVLLLGLDSIGTFMVKTGPDWSGDPTVDLVAGTYFLYAVSEGPMASTLQFSALGGSSELGLEQPIRATFRSLEPRGMVSETLEGIPIPLTRHFGGAESSGTVPITGFFNVRETAVLSAENFEYRWSNQHGVTRCLGHGHEGTGSIMTWVGAVNIENNGPTVSLDYFHSGASVYLRDDIYGFWVDRAPDHPPRAENQVVEPLLWGLDEEAPDVGCARSVVPSFIDSFVP